MANANMGSSAGGDFEDQMVSWFLNTQDSNHRYNVFKKIFQVIPTGDLTRCLSLISKAKKNRKAVAAQGQSSLSQNDEAMESRPERPLPSVPALPLAKSGWLSRFYKEKVVSIDIEKIQIKAQNPTARHKFDQKAAIISVVNHEGKEIFYSKLRRPYNSYEVNPITIKLNGITLTTLQEPDSEDIPEAMQRLKSVLEGKLVVGIELANDINSLEQEIQGGDLETFDLQSYYYRLDYSSRGKRIEESLGLRSLVYHYFNVDMQPDGQIHLAKVDAQWTMRLFLEKYCQISPIPQSKDENMDGTNYINHMVRAPSVRATHH